MLNTIFDREWDRIISQFQQFLTLMHSEQARSDMRRVAEEGVSIDWDTPLSVNEAAMLLAMYDRAKQTMPLIANFPGVTVLIPSEVLNGITRILRDIQPVEQLLRPYANGEWSVAQFEHEVLKSAIHFRRRNRRNPAISKLLTDEV